MRNDRTFCKVFWLGLCISYVENGRSGFVLVFIAQQNGARGCLIIKAVAANSDTVAGLHLFLFRLFRFLFAAFFCRRRCSVRVGIG